MMKTNDIYHKHIKDRTLLVANVSRTCSLPNVYNNGIECWRQDDHLVFQVV